MTNRVDFKLVLITDRNACQGPLIDKIKEALAAGVKAVQLREKDSPARELLSLAKQLRQITRLHKAQLLVNDRLDVALACEADGIQSPEQGVPVQAARPFLQEKLIGKSVHSLEKALEAEADGADFVLFSPVFATQSKQGIMEPQGLEQLERVASSVGIPVFALGGITPERSPSCLKAGAFGIAVISAILKSANVAETVSGFRAALGSE